MVVSAVIAVGVGSAAYAGKKQSSAAWHAQNQAQVRAWQEQVANEQAAAKQAEQTQSLQDQQIAFESSRDQAQQAFTLEREAAAQQQAADLATSAQNQKVSDLTPTVELGTSADSDNSAAAARKRRASFRPEYTSGVTI